MDIEELKQLKNCKYSSMNKNELPDLSTTRIDSSLPVDVRMEQYLNTIHNPYCLKVGKTMVEVKYSNENITIDDKVKEYLISKNV